MLYGGFWNVRVIAIYLRLDCVHLHAGFLKLSRLGFRAACSLVIRLANCLRKAARVGGTWFVGIPVARLVRLISLAP